MTAGDYVAIAALSVTLVYVVVSMIRDGRQGARR